MSELGQIVVGSIQAWGEQFVNNNLHINFHGYLRAVGRSENQGVPVVIRWA